MSYGKRTKKYQAKAPMVKIEDRDKIGPPVGKELAEVSFVELFNRGNGAIKASFKKSFGEYKMPMGVEAMADEAIICNMNNGTVDFVDFEGVVSLTLPDQADGHGPKVFKEPSIATLLLDGRIIVVDKIGIHVYDSDGRFQKTVRPKISGNVYGVAALREEGGSMLVIGEEDGGETYKYMLYDSQLDNVMRTNVVQFPEGIGKKTIRFTAGLGNTIALSDMNKFNQGIWITDTYGNIRHKIGKQGEEDGNFIQAAGICFDKEGNFMAICSKSSRIMVFRTNGDYLCSVQFPEGAIQRPSDLAINDAYDMAVVSLTGQCFMFKLAPGDPNASYPTRGPRPDRGYHVLGRGRGRGRGQGDSRGGGYRGRGDSRGGGYRGRGDSRGGGFRGRGRGGDRGGFKPRY